jgi:hypothetical protein
MRKKGTKNGRHNKKKSVEPITFSKVKVKLAEFVSKTSIIQRFFINHTFGNDPKARKFFCLLQWWSKSTQKANSV